MGKHDTLARFAVGWHCSTNIGTMAYTIVRNYFSKSGRGRVIIRGLTLEEAQAHCSNPETSSKTATSAKARAITRRNGAWFDSYTDAR